MARFVASFAEAGVDGISLADFDQANVHEFIPERNGVAIKRFWKEHAALFGRAGASAGTPPAVAGFSFVFPFVRSISELPVVFSCNSMMCMRVYLC